MKRDLLRRFAYIETCLYWGGGVTAGQLGQTFGITRQNAQASIEAYRQQYPHNMVYNRSTKRHEAQAESHPHCINREPRYYLNYLRGNSLTNHFWEDEDWGILPIEDGDALYRPHLDAKAVRFVVEAIQTKRPLELYYHSKQSGDENLIIAPHHLVYTSKRYHLRAYCYSKNKFIDLVLSRIVDADFAHQEWVSSEEDEEWHNYIELHFKPNPDLPETLKRTLLLDFRLEKGVYTIKARKALKDYIERDMLQLDWQLKIPLWLPVES
ncbi:WYL domain-containing protein [Thiofilum flexile]|uniref:WYL domain-containing protein n=1 Tax=Thiofilum flexile TaxID=125627 RepID=UPI00037B35C9|nr:WYL domain-containing protein [Thiofilum flexile]